jgi:hypothetical protein
LTGLAWAETRTTWNQFVPAAPSLSLKSKILYMQFQEKSFTGTVPAIGTFSFKNDDSLWVSRLALKLSLLSGGPRPAAAGLE